MNGKILLMTCMVIFATLVTHETKAQDSLIWTLLKDTPEATLHYAYGVCEGEIMMEEGTGSLFLKIVRKDPQYTLIEANLTISTDGIEQQAHYMFTFDQGDQFVNDCFAPPHVIMGLRPVIYSSSAITTVKLIPQKL